MAAFLLFAGLAPGAAPAAAEMSGAEQRLYLPDDGAAPGDQFGSALAMDGDWAAAGAPGDDHEQVADVGAVYLLCHEAGEWHFKQKLFAPKPQPAGLRSFGHEVALSGDWLAVGAMRQSAPATHTPVVFLYQKTAGSWELAATLEQPAWTSSHNHEQVALALSGDKLAVFFARPGKAAVYEINGGAWSLTASLDLGERVPSRERLCWAGEALLLSEPGNGPVMGRVLEYRWNETAQAWELQRTVLAPDSTAGDRFGKALAFHAGRVVATDTTGAHCYQMDAAGWTLERSFAFAGPPSTASAVAVSEQHLLATYGANAGLLVSLDAGPAPDWPVAHFHYPRPVAIPPAAATHAGRSLVSGGENVFGGVLGRAGAIIGSDVTSIQQVMPSRSLHAGVGELGASMAVSAETLVVGAPEWSSNTFDKAGYAAVARRDESGIWAWEQMLDCPWPVSDALFGRAVALDGETLAVAAERSSNFVHPGRQRERIYLYRRVAEPWQMALVLEPATEIYQSPITFHFRFGTRLALSGRFLAVEMRLPNTPAPVFTLVYELAEDLSSARLVDRVNVQLQGLQGDVLTGYDPADATPQRLRFFSVSSGGLRQRKAHPYPAGTLAGLQNWPALREFTESFLAASDSTQSWIRTFRRLSNGWAPLAPVPRPPRLTISNHTLECFRHDNGTLLAGSAGEVYGFHRHGNDWQYLRRLNEAGASYAATFGRFLALNQGVAAAVSTPSSLSLFNLNRARVYLNQELPGTHLDLDETVALGDIFIGETTTVALPVRNSGETAFKLAAASIEWSGGQDGGGLVKLPASTASPGALLTATLELKPPAVGIDYEAMVTLHTEPPLARPLRFKLCFHAANARQPALINAEPAPQFVAAGSVLELRPQVEGTLPYQCQWFRNGRALAGQTGRVLRLESARPADAGDYELRASWKGGAVQSALMRVAVFEPRMLTLFPMEHTPLHLEALVWGRGVEVRWMEANELDEIRESPGVRGARSTRLRVARADWLAFESARTVKAVASLFGTTQVVSEYIIEDTHDSTPLPRVNGPRVLVVSELVTGLSVQNLRAPTSHFFALNLPDGLLISPTSGQVTGTPLQTGSWTTVFTVTNARGNQATIRHLLRVVEQPETDFGPARHYAGHVELVADFIEAENAATGGVLPGHAQVSVAASGALSGWLRLGPVRWPLRARLEPAAGNPQVRRAEIMLPAKPGSRAVRLGMEQLGWAGNEDAPMQLTVETRDPQTNHYHGSDWPLAPQLRADKRERDALNGLFTAAWRITTAPLFGLPHPQGAAVASVRARAGRRMRFTLTLPEGRMLMGSALLTTGAEGAAAAWYEHKHSHVLQLTLDFDTGKAVPLTRLGGGGRWHLLPQPGRKTYPQGFVSALLEAKGARYVEPLPGQRVLPSLPQTAPNAVLALNEGGLASRSLAMPVEFDLHLPGGNAVVLPDARQGVRWTRLRLLPRAGMFEGWLEVLTPADTNGAVRGSVKGCLMPTLDEGAGFFLLPHPFMPVEESGMVELRAP